MDPRIMLDSLDAGVAAIGPDWTIAEWSAPAARITGLAAERVVGRNFWSAFPAAKSTPLEQTLRDVLADGEPRMLVTPARAPELADTVFETRVTRAPGNYLLMLFRRLAQEGGPRSPTAPIPAAFDGERRLYPQLFDSLPIPALVVAIDGQILEVNPEGVGLLGGSTADATALRARSLGDWTTEPERAVLLATLRDAVHSRQQLHLTLDSGGEATREVDAVIENVAPGEPSAKLLFLALGVSRELLLQRQILKADRLSQLGALVSGVAHELNNPLAAIAAFAEMLKIDTKSPEQRESAEIIHAEAMRAGRVVQTLLDFARQRSRVRQAVAIKDVAERVVALQKSDLKKAGVQAAILIPDDVPAVIGDPQELQQVLLNVLANAGQAVAATGRPGKVVIGARRAGDQVVVTVEDTGPGVPPDIIDRVFEPFFTTKGEAGTGLGLAISSGLVNAMGGRMYIHNVEGGGASVVVELPMAPVSSVRPEVERPARGAERPLSVLIVEDEEPVRRGMVRMAERLGHRVASASGFDEAVARLKEAGAYDALLVDVHLDEAHSGFDLLETLRTEGRGRARRLIFTTGDSISAGTRDQLQVSQRPVLKKPFHLEELRQILLRVAGEQTGPPQ
ncbi:MAG TPA: ATP-binding protein [Gemmatimonadales bacterium]